MARLVIGIILASLTVLGQIGQLLTPSDSNYVPANTYEAQGYLVGRILFPLILLALSTWLIYSGAKKLKEKK